MRIEEFPLIQSAVQSYEISYIDVCTELSIKLTKHEE